MAQGLAAASPLPQLCMVQGVTRPAPLADGISSSHRELQVGSGGIGTPGKLGTCKHTGEGGAANVGSWGQFAGGVWAPLADRAVSPLRCPRRDPRAKGL